MKLIAESIDIGTRSPTVLLNEADAAELGVHALERIQLQRDGRTTIGIVELTDELISEGTLGVTRRLGHIDGPVEVSVAPQPNSVYYIRKKLDDIELEHRELERIVRDIYEERLADIELGAYVSAIYTNGLSMEETMHLTSCMANIGETISWNDSIIADKHSIGGVAGNRVTPILVSIIAAAGVKIPKTSSRAVTSASGTADTMEVFCDVEFSIEEIREIVKETGGCLVWGGAVNLSPVDDQIIRAETPLSLDPKGQLIASVLSKKKSAGSTHAVIDIPYGEGAKVESLAEARELAEDFNRVSEHLGMTIECAITSGSAPVGRGIGPVLEAREVLATLDGEGPNDLRVKAIRLADLLFESVGVDADATEILDSGAAQETFREILAAQNGDPDVAVSDLSLGRHTHIVRADRDGVVTHINNRLVNEVGRRAGAPKDHGAGLELHRCVGEETESGESLVTVYAESSDKLADAVDLLERIEMVRVRHPDEALVDRV
ncbi:AMP phosphorylase [Haloferax mediterranei ATCC 33500]|uniref:AMP phosphorylase n=1 Tax=Haloferax mediterranei (strain ATCC 33500 / DSM 1411 / JCM 8866 / NBRC 14739 / NCIMB 2177 / R-4) TaxID=523841 RepID=I3R371_HALMT|nr:AMP phosphorylase [Haloferax mediterranei]AFK18681.1 putative thymidine phosphorylase/AMP phosphorylase [Haloferax mediterranei ATCC 33500]AHZ21948.1 thymidine phosphorylase [Haloferax mediterranei ATCC 33500]EMA03458.1 thymidine phosphorylase [Haloferax mediterranei ATCC 33500]MDX5988778.1 AMP phosphorylase [Haloferax mediterranei ATCC 33500]QCQ75181.1 AMP phosphorylase [Haloferax mediterranei ATCC 33500]